MGDNQACMVRYRYEPADGSIQMVDLPGIAHLYMSANHQEDGQPPITALITQEAAATLSKTFKVESFTNLLIQICQDLVALQQVIAPATLVTERPRRRLSNSPPAKPRFFSGV